MTKIIYTSVHPHTTWRLKMSYNVSKPPKKLLDALDAAGWNTRASRASAGSVHEMDITYPGTASEHGSWNASEREEAMSKARKVLAKHGFEVVPYHKMELADCL